MAENFYILSIDGGGFRGVFSAHLLTLIEKEFKIDWRESFGLFTGTSTGAIIAAGLAHGLSAERIRDLYKERGKDIFRRRPLRWLGLLASRYDNTGLKAILTEIFKDDKMGQIEVPLILPAIDIGNGRVHVFKSCYDPQFVRDKDVCIRDAVLASCSAPTYFDPHVVGPYILADGGLWANSPSLVAAIDAKRRLGKRLSDLRILSIGTGVSPKFYSQKTSWWKNSMGWGIAARWGPIKFIEMLLNTQAEAANNMLGLLLEPEQVLRINFDSKSIALDDLSEMKNLISAADLQFTRHAGQIRDFLSIGIKD